MSSIVGPKISVVDSISDGSTYGDIGRKFLRMWQTLVEPNVINTTSSAPPVSPNNGDTYVVAATGSGAWLGQTNSVAYWTMDDPNFPSGNWEFYIPKVGWTVWSAANLGQYIFNGSTWVGARVASFNFQIDGGGSALTTGAKGQWDVPCNATITGWVLTADQSGSCVIDVLKSSYASFPTTASIASTDKPTLASAQKNENLAVSVWTTALSAGDQLQVNVNSATTVTRANLTILVTVP
jgi:hypothetical protein